MSTSESTDARAQYELIAEALDVERDAIAAALDGVPLGHLKSFALELPGVKDALRERADMPASNRAAGTTAQDAIAERERSEEAERLERIERELAAQAEDDDPTVDAADLADLDEDTVADALVGLYAAAGIDAARTFGETIGLDAEVVETGIERGIASQKAKKEGSDVDADEILAQRGGSLIDEYEEEIENVREQRRGERRAEAASGFPSLSVSERREQQAETGAADGADPTDDEPGANYGGQRGATPTAEASGMPSLSANARVRELEEGED